MFKMFKAPARKISATSSIVAAILILVLAFGAEAAAAPGPPAETTLLPTAVQPAMFLAGLPFDLPEVRPAAEPILISLASPSVAALPGAPARVPGAVAAVDFTRLQQPFRGRFAFEKTEKALFDANLALLVAVNIADYFTTREALKYPGLYEANPLMKPFVGNDFAFAAVKTGVTVLNHIALKNLFKRNRTAAWIVATVSNIVISSAVANNMRQIQRARAH